MSSNGAVDMNLMLFHYHPQIWAAYLFIGLFASISYAFIYLNTKSESKFMHILFVTALSEAYGYVLRISTTEATSKVLPFIGSTLLILLSPIFIALVNYIVVGKLMEAHDIDMWCFKAERLSKLFLASDAACILFQSAGGGNNFIFIPCSRD